MVMRGSSFFVAASAIAVGFLACVGDTPTGGTSAVAGTEGGPCLPNMACVTGLTCLSSTCVRLDASVTDSPTTDSPATSDTSPTGDSATCTAPQIPCGNTCVDPTMDVNNCGACGKVCAQGTCAPANGTGRCAKRAFVTSVTVLGDIGMGGGYNGAIVVCKQAAQGLPNAGNFLPWISDSQSWSPAEKFTSGADPIVMARNAKVVVANSMADLLANGVLLQTIDLDEQGNSQKGLPVWTNTDPKGTRIGASGTDSCGSWMVANNQITGWYGLVGAAGPEWTHAPNTAYCNTPAHLYCFEQ